MSAYDEVKVKLGCEACGASFEDKLQVKVYMGGYEPCYWSDPVALGEPMPEGFPGARFEEVAYGSCPHCKTIFQAAVLFDRGRPVDVRRWSAEDGLSLIRPPGPRESKRTRRRLAAEEWSRRETAQLRERFRARMQSDGVIAQEPTARELSMFALSEAFVDMLEQPSFARLAFCGVPTGTKTVGPYEQLPGGEWRRKSSALLGLPERPLPIPRSIWLAYDDQGQVTAFILDPGSGKGEPAIQQVARQWGFLTAR